MIVAGFGFRVSATAGSLLDALEKASGAHEPTHVAAPDDKIEAAALQAVSQQLSLPIVSVSAEALQRRPVLTYSDRVAAARGVGSVAEAAALAAAGDGGRLVGPRQISSDRLATCAIAIGGAL